MPTLIRNNAQSPARVFLTTDAVGGVWTYTLALASGLVDLGSACTAAVLGPAPSGPQRGAAYEAGLELLETGLALEWTAKEMSEYGRMAAVLAGLAADANADIIHLHTAALASFEWPAPVVTVAHSCVGTWWQTLRGGVMPPDLQWRADAVRVGLRAAAAVIAPSEAFAASLRACYGFRGKIDVVHNGVATQEMSVEPREQHVLCAGRLWDPGKNMATLDEAAALIDYPVLAAGPAEGADGSSFTANQMKLLGVLETDDLAAAYRAAAVFAAPSLYEPFGLAVLEAASQATPLCLADIPIFRELWDGAALFIPARDAKAWAASMTALIQDSDRRSEYGRLASARAAKFTAQATTVATRAIHARICALAQAAA